MESIVLRHYLLRVFCHLRLHMREALHKLQIRHFLPFQFSSKKDVLVVKHLVVPREVLVIFEELEVVLAFNVHSSIIILIEIAA